MVAPPKYLLVTALADLLIHGILLILVGISVCDLTWQMLAHYRESMDDYEWTESVLDLQLASVSKPH